MERVDQSKYLFKPQLNSNSLRIASRKYRNDQSRQVTVATRLIEKKREYDVKMIEMKN